MAFPPSFSLHQSERRPRWRWHNGGARQLPAGSETRFLPYGEYRVEPTADLTDHGYTGHKQQDAVGLIYMRARYYVPGVGRFASADTIDPNPVVPQSLNRFSYALANPVRHTDPSGHCTPGVDCVRDHTVEAIYWRNLSADELAKFQRDQGHTNNCGPYSAAAAYNMLTGARVWGKDLAGLANLRPGGVAPFRSATRMFPWQATFPMHQANLLNRLDAIAQKYDAPVPHISARHTNGTPEELIGLLEQPDKVVIVTMQWPNDDNLIPSVMEGHAMVLAAYDPTYTDADDNVKPWGFINSHGESELTWLSNDEFQQRWGGCLFFIGHHMMVVAEIVESSAGF